MFSGQIDFSSTAKLTPCQRFRCRINKDLLLRQLTLEDAAELFALTEANRIRLRQWLPWLDDSTAAAQTRQFIQRKQAIAEVNQEVVAAICYRGAIAGLISLHTISWPNQKGSIGYWLGQAYERKGLMTAACTAVIDYAFTDLALHRIEILCATQNVRSRAIPKRLGFTYEGILRESQCLYGRFVDHEIYAILSHEWPPSTPSPSTPPPSTPSP